MKLKKSFKSQTISLPLVGMETANICIIRSQCISKSTELTQQQPGAAYFCCKPTPSNGPANGSVIR